MKRQPILDIGLITNKQSLETVQPRIRLLNHSTPFVKFFVKIDPLDWWHTSRTGVGSNVGLNVPSLTSLPQVLGIKSAIRVEKQAFKVNLDPLQQDAQLLKEFVNLKQPGRRSVRDDFPLVGWRKPTSRPNCQPRTNSSLSWPLCGPDSPPPAHHF